MNYKMQQENSFIGLAVTGTAWVCMRIFLFFGIESLADLASIATVTSAFVVIVANVPRFMVAISKFITTVMKFWDNYTKKSK